MVRTILAPCFALLFAAFIAISGPAAAQAQSVSVVNQTTVNTGNDSVSGPEGVAVDSAGDVFIADTRNSRVVEVPAGCTGDSCQVAFTGLPSRSYGVAVDKAGDVLVTGGDCYSCGYAMEFPAGCTTSDCLVTLSAAGSNELDLPFSIVTDSAGDIFIADANHSRVLEIPAGCSSVSCHTNYGTGFTEPYGLAFDSAGDLFVADAALTSLIEIPAGCTTSMCQQNIGSGFNEATGVALDVRGNIFVSQFPASSLVEIPMGCSTSACQTTVGSGLNDPIGLAADPQGDIYVADDGNSRVEEIYASARNFGTVNVGANASLTLTFNINSSVTIGSVQALTVGAANQDYTITANTCTGAQTAPATCTVTVQFSPITAGWRQGAVNLLDGSGNLLVTEFVNGVGVAPQVIFPGGPTTTVPTVSGSAPQNITLDGAGDLYVSNTNNSTGLMEIPAGCTSTSCEVSVDAGVDNILASVLDGAGNLYFGYFEGSLEEIPAGCTAQSCQKNLAGIANIEDLATDGLGDVYLANNIAGSPAYEYTASGQSIAVGNSSLSGPLSIALDSNGDVFVAANSGGLDEVPAGTSSLNNIINSGDGFFSVRLDPAGDILIVGLNNLWEYPVGCFTQSCALQLASGFSNSDGIARDNAGDVYVADQYNTNLTLLHLSQPPALSFTGAALGEATAAQSVVLQNTGTAALTFGNTPFLASSNFSVASTTCGATLAPGATCAVEVTFTPASYGTTPGTLTISDNSLNNANATQVASLSGSLAGVAPTLGPSTIPQGEVTVAYNQAFTTTGTPAPTVSLTGGSFPAGLTLNAGVLSGTTTMSGTFNFTLTAANGVSPSASQAYSLTVNPAVAISANNNYSVTVNTAASIPLTVSGGVAPYTLFYVQGVPAGMSAALAGSTVTISGTPTLPVGTYETSITIQDSLGGTGNADFTMMVQMANQAALSVNVTSPAAYGTSQMLTTTGGSGTGAVSYSVGASTACSVSGAMLSITAGTGTCSVTATKASDGTYNATTSGAATVVVQEATQAALSVVATSPATYGTSQTLSTTGGSGTGAVTYSAGASTACSVSGAMLSIASGTGTCSVTATKASDGNYNAQTSSAATVTVQKANESALAVVATSPETYGTTQTLSTTGGSGTGAVSYSVGSSTACSVSGATLSITSGTGTCSVTATKAADTNYNAQTSSAATVMVQKANEATLTVNVTSPATQGSTQTLTTTGGSGTGAVSYGVGSSTACSVSGATLTITAGTGTCFVTATKAADTNYNAATSAAATVVVQAAAATLKVSPTSMNYGTVYPGTILTDSVTLTNTGKTTITISGLSLSGSQDFQYINLCGKTLAAGKSCIVQLVFGAVVLNKNYSPTGTLTITDNAPGSPQTVALSATIINPVATLSASSIAFGTVKTGTTSAAKTVTLKNSGTTNLDLSAVSITSGFTLTSATTCKSTTVLAPNATCVLSATFTPASKGAKTGSITVTDNAASKTQTVSLTGTGD